MSEKQTETSTGGQDMGPFKSWPPVGRGFGDAVLAVKDAAGCQPRPPCSQDLRRRSTASTYLRTMLMIKIFNHDGSSRRGQIDQSSS